MKYLDMTGKVFGRLTVKAYGGSRGSAKHAAWYCDCTCGTTDVIVRGAYLRQGRIVSCGCRAEETKYPRVSEIPSEMKKTRWYSIWCGMRTRCKNENNKKAHLYAKKGIRVCERWNDPMAFLEDMGQPPPRASIDRIDGNKGYEPDNCRWATSKQQANNCASNLKLSFSGETKNLSEWAASAGIKANTLGYRIRRGWGIERALTTKPSKTLPTGKTEVE